MPTCRVAHSSTARHLRRPAGQVFSAAHFAADLLAVLDAEGVEETALVCHSFGGGTLIGRAREHRFAV